MTRVEETSNVSIAVSNVKPSLGVTELTLSRHSVYRPWTPRAGRHAKRVLVLAREVHRRQPLACRRDDENRDCVQSQESRHFDPEHNVPGSDYITAFAGGIVRAGRCSHHG